MYMRYSLVQKIILVFKSCQTSEQFISALDWSRKIPLNSLEKSILAKRLVDEIPDLDRRVQDYREFHKI